MIMELITEYINVSNSTGEYKYKKIQYFRNPWR